MAKASTPAKIKSRSNAKVGTLDILNEFESESGDFLVALKDIAASESHVMQDPRLDMRELPRAKNSYEWLAGKKFLNYAPFARQLEFIGKLNSCVCVNCSPDFYDDPHDFKKPYQEYIDDYVYFEDGICPECGYTRAQAVADGELSDKILLVGVAGQRCVAGNTLVRTDSGPVPISRISADGNIRCEAVLHDGNYPIVNKFQSKNKMFRITTSDGRFIDVSPDHRLFCIPDNPKHKIKPGYYTVGKNGLQRGSYLEITPDDLPTRRFVEYFIEPNNYQAELIDFGMRVGSSFRDNNIKFNIHTDNYGYMKTRAPSVKGPFGPLNITNTAPAFLWGGSVDVRDLFFLGLTRWDHSIDRDVYVHIPWVWANAFKVWMDEFGIIPTFRGIRRNVIEEFTYSLNLNAMWHAGFPLEYLLGKETERFAMHDSIAQENIQVVPKTLCKIYGARATDIIKTFGEGPAKIDLPIIKLNPTLWQEIIEMIEIFASRASDGAMSPVLTQNAVDSFRRLQKLLNAHGLHNYVFYQMQKLIDDLSREHKRRYVKITSIRKLRGEEELFDIEVQQKHKFFANGINSHNSSKSRTAAMGITYSMHRLFHTGNPSGYYGLLPGTLLSGVVTATVIDQAKKNVYIPGLQNVFQTSPWFKDYFLPWLNEKGKIIGHDLYRIGEEQSFFKFGMLNIQCASPDSRRIRGFTSFATVVDELSRFSLDEDHVRADGAEINSALMYSLSTVEAQCAQMRERGMSDVIFPINYAISSPLSDGDPIMTLRRNNRKNPSAITFVLPTWKFNPNMSEKRLRQNFGSPTFDRDYGCVPQKTTGTFFPNTMSLKAMLGDKKNGVKIMRTEYTAPTGQIFTTGKLSLQRRPKNLKSILALDAGLKFNAFGLAVGHIEEETEDYPEAFVIDAVGEIQPLPDRPIHFSSVVHGILSPIIDEFGCQLVVSDRWNSAKLLQDISDEHAIDNYEHQLKIKDFINFRQEALDEKIIMPREEMDLEEAVAVLDAHQFKSMPVAHFYHQCASVREGPKSVDKGHGLNFTDDIFRAVVLAWRMSQEEEIREKIIANDEENDEPPLLVLRSLSDTIKPIKKEEPDPNKEFLISVKFGSDQVAPKKRS